MYTILSPSKTQDFHRALTIPKDVAKYSKVSQWNTQTKNLAKVMKELSAKELGKLMKISPKLSQLNWERFQNWDGEYGTESTHAPAILAFLGDVYKGFDLESWRNREYNYAHAHLGIASGFYGLISPLNYIQPYRLEMGTRMSFTLNNVTYKNLYYFWSETLTEKMFQILKTEKTLVNLASVEYSKVIDRKLLKQKVVNDWRDNEQRNTIQIIDIDFKIRKPNKKTGKIEEKVIAIYAKRARGMMANWIVKNRVDTPRELKKFTVDGWEYREASERDKLGNIRMLFIKQMV